MQRILTSPRANWPQRVREYGLTFHTINGETYWDESCYYHFTASEVDLLEDATNDLHRICLETVDYIIRANLFEAFRIPAEFVPLIVKSWEQRQTSLYGRFDLVYDGVNPPKMLEYNADTPTALLEASVIQWFWLQETYPQADQFNSIHEHLLPRFQMLHRTLSPVDNPIFYFSSISGHEEDFITVNYLRDLAMQAGFATEYLAMKDIGWHARRECFTDLQERPICRLFKLYPWEWMVHEAFGPYLLKTRALFFEPMWKMLLSNKALLPLLWQRYPHHPNLLRAEWEPFGSSYVKKPILAREGANVTIVSNDQVLFATPGTYTESPCIYQEYCPLPNFTGNYPVIGSWVVGDTACGMGVREDSTPITHNSSRFVPHMFT